MLERRLFDEFFMLDFKGMPRDDLRAAGEVSALSPTDEMETQYSLPTVAALSCCSRTFIPLFVSEWLDSPRFGEL